MRPPAKKSRAQDGSEQGRALAWLDSYPKVSRWMQQYDIEQLVDEGGGFALVPKFLPGFVAEGALQILQRLPHWSDTAAEEDYTHNNISHRFFSSKGSACSGGDGGTQPLDTLLRAFSLLRPGQLNAFSAARYERDHHIAPHDDRAYTPVLLDTGDCVEIGGFWCS